MPRNIPAFAAPYAPPDEALARELLAARPSAEVAAATQEFARRLLALTRARRGGIGGVEDFLHEFALSSREGLAVMALAESLLREDSLGIVYPSVRHTGGTCVACFRPALVTNVRKGRTWRFTWEKGAGPRIERVRRQRAI